MANLPVLLELTADEVLTPYADALALQLGADGAVFVPRPGIDPRARSAVSIPADIIVRIESSTGEAAVALWLESTVRQLSSGQISGKVQGRGRTFSASNRDSTETLRSLIEGE
jgi:hypothetical protein